MDHAALIHGSALRRARLTNTHIMSILCNATYDRVQRHIFYGAEYGVTAPDRGWAATLRQFVISLSAVGSSQLLGLTASIAARLTAWPISLACSASERIWPCT
ncbi:hypothetical protein ACVISU_005677 [Bradyrhizobium sp. USDA 4452]